MSGYLAAHGPTATVELVVNNTYHTYRETQDVISRVTWWDDEDGTWNDVEKAAREDRGIVESIDRHADGMTDLIEVDYDQVDFVGIVRAELVERNLIEGREREAGL